MKLQEIPIYWDLVKLPPAVVAKRIWKRMSAPKVPADIEVAPADLLMLDDILPPPDQWSPHWELLLNYWLDYKFNYLGSGWTSLLNNQAPLGFMNWRYGNFPRPGLGENEPDWNRDQRSGFQFTATHPALALKSGFETDGVDVKFCWEFSRMHPLPMLALLSEYLPERRPEILLLYEKLLRSFHQQCPLNQGINWASPMEVSIRLINILVSYQWMGKYLPGLGELVKQMSTEHFCFIARHPERKDGFGTNHHLCNLTALVVASRYLQGEYYQQQGRQAYKALEVELSRQFFSDGINFEFSTYYHRLSTEIAMLGINYALKQQWQVQQETLLRLGKSISAIKYLGKPDSTLPCFGDIDSGRILDFNPAAIIEDGRVYPRPERHGFILRCLEKGNFYHWFYGELLEKISVKPPAGNMAGNTSRDLTSTLKYVERQSIPLGAKIKLEKLKAYHWPEGGLACIKSSEFYLAVNLMTARSGHRYRGHSHNDKGSFDLMCHSKALVEDAGVLTYTATAAMRNRYRATRAHHVPWFGIEQNDFLPTFWGLFHMRHNARARLLHLEEKKLICEVKYRGIYHRRTFEIKEGEVIVTDEANRPFSLSHRPPEICRSYGRIG